MGRMKLPRAILFDLDDTILVAFGPAQSQWQRTIAVFADRLGPIEATVIAAAIQAASTELWSDPARHKFWRRRIVVTAFAALAAAGHPVPPEAIGDALPWVAVSGLTRRCEPSGSSTSSSSSIRRPAPGGEGLGVCASSLWCDPFILAGLDSAATIELQPMTEFDELCRDEFGCCYSPRICPSRRPSKATIFC
jgi:hypothetical protein